MLCLKLHILNHTSGLWQKQLKKKKTTNTFFVGSSNRSMLAKSHQEGIGRKGSYLAVAPIIKLKALKQDYMITVVKYEFALTSSIIV